MKNTNIPFLFGAVFVASFAVVHCGGSDQPLPGTDGTAGTTTHGSGGSSSVTTGGVTTGAGGDNSGTGTGGSDNGNGGDNSGTTTGAGGSQVGTGGTNGGTGGKSGTGGGGGTGATDAGGPARDAGGNAGCPATAPRTTVACQVENEMCPYAGEECTCERAGGGVRPGRDGGTVDAGFRGVWNCARIRDAGANPMTCPATAPMNMEACEPAMAGLCSYGNTRCFCAGGGRRDAAYEWTCL
jgi:hypothetical protein